MITYKEFQIKVMANVFKKINDNIFEPSLYMLTKENRNKIGPLPVEIFEQKVVIANICKEMNALAGSKYCCFVSECNFTKIDKEQCDKIGIDFDNFDQSNMTTEEAEKLRSLSVEALVFNFESLTDPAHLNLFKFIDGQYLPVAELAQENQIEDIKSVFSNLLCK